MQYPVMHMQEMLVLDHVLAFIICVIAPLVAFSSQKVSIGDLRFDTSEKIKLYHSNAMFLLIIALAVISIWRVTGKSMVALGFDWPVWNSTMPVLFGLVLLFYGLDVFFQYGLKRWRDKTIAERNNALVFVPSNARELWHFSLLALAAGIGEEIIFRGFLIQYFVFWVGNDLRGIIFAAVFSSAIFAFLHGYQGFKSIVKIFFLSLLLSAIFILSKSLVFVIIIHAIIDLVSGSISAFLLDHHSAENMEEE